MTFSLEEIVEKNLAKRTIFIHAGMDIKGFNTCKIDERAQSVVVENIKPHKSKPKHIYIAWQNCEAFWPYPALTWNYYLNKDIFTSTQMNMYSMYYRCIQVLFTTNSK